MNKVSCALAVLTFLCTPAFAEDSDSEKKTALVNQLVQLTGKPESQLIDGMLPPLRPIARNLALKSLTVNKTLTAPEREQKANELTERLLQRFHELMMQAGLKKAVDSISTRYLTSHFNLEDIQYLVSFYNTDTGKSTITKLPHCMVESQAQLKMRLKPQFDRVAKEVFAESPTESPAQK